MSGFTRKRSIDRRLKADPNLPLETLNSTKTSLRPSSSKLPSASNKNYQQCLQRVELLLETDSETLSLDKFEREASEVMSSILDLNKGVLNSQKLVGYRQCSLLFTKLVQTIKKNSDASLEFNSQPYFVVYRGISEQLNNITKQQRNDELVLEAALSPSIMGVLEALASLVEEDALKIRERKPLLMRKSSLKKVAESPTTTGIRPSSRGKLSSLSKKERIGSKADILDIKGKQKSQESETFINIDNATSVLEAITLNLAGSIKNISANKKVRRDLLKEEYIRLINRYLLIWNEKSFNLFSNNVLVQLTSACRHLAAEDRSTKVFLKSNCFEPWTRLIEMFPTSNDLVFNLLRIISKLSANAECCWKLNERKAFVKTLSSFFKIYKDHIHIVIRVSFVFANMTSYISDIRKELYHCAWDDIFQCFQHYSQSELQGKSQVDKMGISMAAWDLPAMKKESDVEALMKIIRLIANLFTEAEIGQHVYREHADHYRQLIKSLKMLLAKKSDIEKYNQLIACVLSCLTNTLYYDREMLLASLEYKTVKKELIDLLVDFVVQIEYEEVCCESLRVVSNLTRMKQFIKPVLEAKLHEAVMILLDSTSKQIVYYSLGIIINLLADDEFKSTYSSSLVASILQILSECDSQDFDVVGVSLKALAVIIENRSENIEPKQMLEIEACLVGLGTSCDRVMLEGEQSLKGDMQSAQESRNLINVLLNSMPEQKFTCPVKNCGRKFTDESKLQEHVSRRHKLS